MVSLDSDLSTQVAVMVSEGTALDSVANRIAAEARAQAARHNITGGFEASIGVDKVPGKKGVTDREVFSDDPEASNIEMGHLSELPNLKGKLVWVKGLHILRNAGRKINAQVSE